MAYLFLGLIRPYKGVEVLLEVFAGMKDWTDAIGAYLFDATSENAVRCALESAYTDRERLPAMGAHNQVKCRQWSWDMIARETAKVYRQCLGGL